MTQLVHLQKVILSIAKDIDQIARKNNIDYYLLGGSAIGAIRHKGFIPWDDDLDIILTDKNYHKLLEALHRELDPNKYYIQEGLKDWPMAFSKVKLIGTHLCEYEGVADNQDHDGIYVDIFKMDNVINDGIRGRLQYFFGKLYLCYQLSIRSYKSGGMKKRLLMALSSPLKIRIFRNFVVRQIEKYNGHKTPYLGFFYGRTRWKSGVIPTEYFGNPKRVPFEDTMFPVAELYHEYLSQVFGDYMTLPPVEQRKGLHLISVDFGKY